jgi:hypothetical protein
MTTRGRLPLITRDAAIHRSGVVSVIWWVSKSRAFQALQAIVRGSRDPDLAENPALGYDDAAEVQLLLEALGPG